MDPLEPIRCIKHGSVVFEYDDVVVYVDPFDLEQAEEDADLIIITHSHYDHYSPKDIKQICKDDTCYATTAKIAVSLENDLGVDRAYISHLSYDSPPAVFECGVMITPVPAENANHPLEAGFGVILEFAGYKYYITSDTDIFAESAVCDIMFVVCDGVYNMKDYLNEIPRQIKSMDVLPKLVIPYHCPPENATALCGVLTENGIACKVFKN